MTAAMWLLLLGSAGAALAVSWLPGEAEPSAVQPVDRVARAGQRAKLEPSVPRPADASVPLTANPASLPTPLPDAPVPAAMTAATTVARTAWPALSPAARQAWTPPLPPPPPPPPPVVVPPPAPPPAFPYQWLGQIEEEGQVRFFLANAQRTVALRAGDVLDQRWRINGADDTRLLLTWLPTETAVSVIAK